MPMTRGQIIEAAFWVILALGAFVLTFDFNQDLDIYEFGAYGWPRAVILMIALTLAGQIYHDIRFKGVLGVGMEADAPDENDGDTEGPGSGYYLRMVATLGLPLVFGLLLQPVGFYVLTPLFIATFLYVAGERRVKWIIGVTVGLYAFLTFVFVKIFFVGLPVGTIQIFYDISNFILGVIR